MSSSKAEKRQRRLGKTRSRIARQQTTRLCIFRTPRHIYAQIISPTGNEVLVSASTVEKDRRGGTTGNIEAAGMVGKLTAERARDAGIEKVAFDRSGYAYHGRVKALADAAREGGLKF